LGVLSGHWPIPQSIRPSDPDGVEEDVPDWYIRSNSGITVVTPAQHVLDLLNSFDVVEDRMKRAEHEKAQEVLGVQDSGDSETFTKADFQDALRKASRRVKPGVDTPD